MRTWRASAHAWHRERGSQLVELAFAVPVLLLLAVGIWDIGAGFGLKQKLTNAAREGARIIVSSPGVNCNLALVSQCPSAPVTAAVNAVVQYLDEAGLNASCLTGSTPSSTGSPWQYEWTYTCNGITLDINHGATVGGTALTEVTLTYPITWTQGQLLPAPVPAAITTKVDMANLAP